MKITLKHEGSRNYTKTSYPVRYGVYSQIDYNDFRFQFNLNGEVKYISGTGPDWPHPAEWLKRTPGNDWLYYSTGDYYAGVVDILGEYYFPFPAYPTNCLFKENPFVRSNVITALKEMANIPGLALEQSNKLRLGEEQNLRDFLNLVGKNSTELLRKRADTLHRILQARVSVLPPDCRHVDYDVIPVMINEGCLYNCPFCEVKSGMDLSFRPREQVRGQLFALREFYGLDLVNYNSIYLGQHDALASEPEDILFAVQEAYKILQIEQSYMHGPKLFLFGSAESFLHMGKNFWENLNRLPFYTYVNLGLESFDKDTLEFLKKPLGPQDMLRAFRQMLEINKSYENIEITANFVLGDDMPPGHIPSLLEQMSGTQGKHLGKGCVYISPLKGSTNSKDILRRFREIKQQSRIDTFLYLIQRL